MLINISCKVHLFDTIFVHLLNFILSCDRDHVVEVGCSQDKHSPFSFIREYMLKISFTISFTICADNDSKWSRNVHHFHIIVSNFIIYLLNYTGFLQLNETLYL